MRKITNIYKKLLPILTALLLVFVHPASHLKAQESAATAAVAGYMSVALSNAINDILETARAKSNQPGTETKAIATPTEPYNNFSADNTNNLLDPGQWPLWAQEIFFSTINKYFECSIVDAVDYIVSSTPLSMAAFKASYKISALNGLWNTIFHLENSFIQDKFQGLKSTAGVLLGAGAHFAASSFAPIPTGHFLSERNHPIAFKTLARFFEATIMFALTYFDKTNKDINSGIKTNKAISANAKPLMEFAKQMRP